MKNIKIDLLHDWKSLYPNLSTELLDDFIFELDELKQILNIDLTKTNTLWYKEAVVYSLYVDLFNKDFQGLIDRLPYIKDLGINCLWLLPVLDSPMKDAGFDILDYRKIRAELLGAGSDDIFDVFLDEAHNNGIKVIFDIAMNHTSDQHSWFKQSILKEKNKYSDYYIWSDNDEAYSDCRLLFKGMCDSNWEKNENGKFFFHRFFEFQPDLNYRNPEVLLDMCRNLMFWINKGVDGFRADAIPYLWKEEGTNCENLDNTHVIIKFFRKVVDYLKPDVLLLAEACQPPKEVVKYMGDGDECHAGYHFPLMPQIFKAIASNSSDPIRNVLETNITPEIPENCQWFTFLRCHDELSLELVYVSEEDREYIHSNYCHNPDWDFRMGEGISARLSELFKFNVDKIIQAFSVMLSLPGTPIIYYGDEFAKANDQDYYQYQIKITGHNDTRNLVRGKINWKELEGNLKDDESLEYKIFSQLKSLIAIRKTRKELTSGKLSFIDIDDSILAYERESEDGRIIVLHNLSDSAIQLPKDLIKCNEILFGQKYFSEESQSIFPNSTLWCVNK